MSTTEAILSRQLELFDKNVVFVREQFADLLRVAKQYEDAKEVAKQRWISWIKSDQTEPEPPEPGEDVLLCLLRAEEFLARRAYAVDVHRCLRPCLCSQPQGDDYLRAKSCDSCQPHDLEWIRRRRDHWRGRLFENIAAIAAATSTDGVFCVGDMLDAHNVRALIFGDSAEPFLGKARAIGHGALRFEVHVRARIPEIEDAWRMFTDSTDKKHDQDSDRLLDAVFSLSLALPGLKEVIRD